MKPEQYQQAFEALMLCGWLVLYMYLAINSLMLVLHYKIKIRDIIRVKNNALIGLMSSEKTPCDYFKARVYFVGSVICILLPMLYVWT